jgi:Tfp pilus assembly protein PilF
LQKDILAKLEEKIKAHEQDYYLHIAVADLYVSFYQFGGEEYLIKAKQHIDRALELSPNRQQAYYIIARIELSRGNRQGTIEALKKAVEIDPNVGDTRFFYGLVAYEFGDIKTGDEQIAKAKELGRVPKTAQEAMNLAVVIGDRKGDYGGAVEILKNAVELAKTSTNKTIILNARLRLAVAYYMAEQYANAKEAFGSLAKDIDLRTLPMWPQLEPVMRELGVRVAK